MTSTFSFHPVHTEADIARLATLARDIWVEHYVPFIGAAQVEYMLDRFQSPAAIADQIRGGMVYWRFGSPQAPAGYLAYLPETGYLFLSKIYVAAPHRRRGWARRAFERLVRQELPSRVELTVNRHNTASIQAYRSLGFQKTGTRVTDIGHGFVMDDFVMQWRRAEGK